MGRTTTQIALIGMAVGIAVATGTGLAGAQSDPAPAEQCAAREAVPLQLRPLDCRLAAAIAAGLERSATFRHLVERVGALNGIVYIHLKPYVNPQTGRVLDGGLSHAVTTAGAHRVLQMMVGAGHGDRPIFILAHELQHAIEVLEAPDVSTEHAVDQLFERIGTHVYAGAVETQAALDVESTVRRELLDRDHDRVRTPSRDAAHLRVDVVPFAPRPDGAVIVPVAAEGAGPLNFLLDTGSAGSTIVEPVAARLGLAPIARSLVTTPAGREWRPVVKVGRLAVGSASVDGVLATTVPVSALETIRGQIDGVLGQDFLSRFNYTLDYRKHHLHWDSETSSVDDADARLRLMWVDDRFLVELPQTGGQSVRFVPDSGSDVVVVFLRPGRPILPLDAISARAELNSLGSRRDVHVQMLRRLTIGSTTLTDRPAAVVERLEPDAPDYDGLLPLHIFASVSFNSVGRWLVVREH